jgi:hypothetical protein
MKKINLVKEVKKIVSDKEFLVNLLSTATFSSFWTGVGVHEDTDKEVVKYAREHNECREDVWADVLLKGGYLFVDDVEEEESYKISLDDVINGFIILMLKYPTNYANIIDENEDYYDADAWLQCTVFGEVIYG